MRTVASSEMIDITALLAVLLIFFSIDIRSREPVQSHTWATRMFEWTSRVGGVCTAFALALGWVSHFLPDASSAIRTVLIAGPGSIGIACAIVLGVEMLWQRDRPDAQ
ncbi:MAG TPA: hypothetical protein VK060_01170 [Ruania sp.]|nr:hypothetical protein [Ruania sp.]